MRLWNPNRDETSDTIPSPAVAIAADDTAVRDAYDRGRRDERARRRRSPALVLALVLAALVGGWTLGAAALRGSFEGGGRMIDGQLVTAGQEAGPAVEKAARGAARLARGDTPGAGQE